MATTGSTIRSHMARRPRTIASTATLGQAHRLMRTHDIRHLPVLKRGKLVGIVSVRDLHLIETLQDVDPERVAVEDAMTPEPYTVSPNARLQEVVEKMAEHKWGSAVVVERGKVVGMFTTTDALRLLGSLLRPSRPGAAPTIRLARRSDPR